MEIFDVAEHSVEAGYDLSDMTILIGPEGGIRLLADCDWPLDSLQVHSGARMVYRVSQQEKSVRLEGRAGSRTCLVETERPNGAARRLLADTPTSLLHRNLPVAPLLPAIAAPTEPRGAPTL